MLLHTSLLRSERPRRDSPLRHPRTTFTTLVHFLMATNELPGDVSDDSWDTGHPALPMNWVSTVPRTFPQYTRPFEPWSDIARDHPGHLEVVRFLRQRDRTGLPCGLVGAPTPHVIRKFPVNGAWMPYICATKANERTASACTTFRCKRILPAFCQNSSTSRNLVFHICSCPRKHLALRPTPTSRQAEICRTRQARELRWTARGHCEN
jgi:hypothetical protein